MILSFSFIIGHCTTCTLVYFNFIVEFAEYSATYVIDGNVGIEDSEVVNIQLALTVSFENICNCTNIASDYYDNYCFAEDG